MAPHDAGDGDAGELDAGTLDSGQADGGPADGGPVDGGPTDGGPQDSGPPPQPDGGCDAGAVEFCDNGVDDDCNGEVDCADSACASASCGPNGRACVGITCTCSGNGGTPQPAEGFCGDGHDNDCNGLADCADPGCAASACGANGLTCSDGGCACSGNGGTPQSLEASCGDTFDNDCSGFTDCADSNCAGSSCGAGGKVCVAGACVCTVDGGAVEVAETTCGDGLDNDCDGLVDCDDSDCLGQQCLGTSGFSCVSAGNCSCGTNLSVADATHHGRSSTVDLGTRPATLYVHAPGGVPAGYWYTECTAGCSTATPTFAAPVRLAQTFGGGLAELRPRLVATGGGGLAAFWRSSSAGLGRVTYAECAGGCLDAGSWALVDLDGGYQVQGTTVGLAALGNRRSVVFGGDNPNSALYGECTGSCTAGLASWAFTTLPQSDAVGASVALSGGFPTRRTAVFGQADGGVGALLYGECTSSCTSTGWATLQIGSGTNPDVVMDSAGLPRVFYVDAWPPPGELLMSRCTQRPCTSLPNWTTASVATEAGDVTAGVASDAGTWFTAGLDSGTLTGLSVGVELPDGGYAVSSVSACAGTVRAVSPSGYQGSGGRWRLVFDDGTNLKFLYQAP